MCYTVSMSWFDKLLKRDSQSELRLTLGELSGKTGINYKTLWAAADSGRLRARQSGSIWLSSVAAVEEAIREGRMRG